MAVFKRLTCKSCGAREQAPKEERIAPPCPKCGGERVYSRKWYVTFYERTSSGKRKPVTKAVSTKKADAELFEGRSRVGRAEGNRIPDGNPTMDQAFDLFINFLEMEVLEGRIAEGTKVYYEKRVNNHLRPWLKKLKLTDFVTKAEALADQHKRKRIGVVSAGTLNRELATLKRFCSFAKRKKLLPVNPLMGYELLTENNQRDRVLSQVEIERLLKECKSGRLKLAVTIALETGLRREGVLTLKWKEIDWTRNEIRKVVKHHRRRGEKRVEIPLTPMLREALLDWKKKQKVEGIEGYVITSPKKPSTHMLITSDFGFQSACIRAGIEDFTFHDLRHCFATYFLRRTKNLHALAEILGHSPQEEYRMSRRYAHILSDEKHRAMEEFAGGYFD